MELSCRLHNMTILIIISNLATSDEITTYLNPFKKEERLLLGTEFITRLTFFLLHKQGAKVCPTEL